MGAIGIVVIGKNEGERLLRCLDSVLGRGHAVVYVDSGSSDQSVTQAQTFGAEVVELDQALPFTAARARNEGAGRLVALDPAVRLIQFVDGDSEVVDGWLERAAAEFEARPDLAVVCGRLRERFPEHSLYNRLGDLEWDIPAGEVDACGGIAMFRRDAFETAGRFDPTVAAGEEPELCQRLRLAGWKIRRLDAEMARHDLAITRFGPWWRRQVRTGYGGLDVATRFAPGDGRSAPFARINRSTRLWTIGWLLALILGGLVAGHAVGPAVGWATAGLLAAAPVVQALRLAARVRPRVASRRDALAFGLLTMISKWGQLVGQWRYLRDRHAGRHPRPSEPPRPGAGAAPATSIPLT